MHMEEKFELEVLTRLAVIESKIDDYKLIKEKSNEAYNLANRNLETIDKIEDRNKWLWRTSVGALITGLIGMLPVIHQANQIGGLLCGLIEALIVVWVMFTVITALGGTTQMSQLIGQIHDNVVTDFIYNNNPIMKMLLKAVN